MGKLTEAQVANLRHVEKFGEAKPRSRAGHWCRKNGLTEWVWRKADGTLVRSRDVPLPYPDGWLNIASIVGERLTRAGRLALSQMEKSDDSTHE